MFYARPATNVTGKNHADEAWQRLLAFFLPAPCLACQQPVAKPRRSFGLCAACHEQLVRWPTTGCWRCGKLLQAADPPPGYQCGSCRKSPPPLARLLSRFSYQTPLEAVIAGLKFRRLDYLGRQLGEELARIQHHEFGEVDLVTAVPLHWLRHLQRGYNQAWIVAQPIARALDRPLVRLLRRHLITSPQRGLKRQERLANLRDAFRPRQASRLRDQRILLVDDVITTGATLSAAASCLRRAGARSIVALTVARTPDRDEARWLTVSVGVETPSVGVETPAKAR